MRRRKCCGSRAWNARCARWSATGASREPGCRTRSPERTAHRDKFQGNEMARLEELFESALDLPASEREAFLSRECAGDEALRAAVERLLASDQVAEEQTFWKGSALNAEAKLDAPAGALRVGQVLGDFRITEAIGEGGMGTVYRAVRADAEYEQAVAIKIVRGGFDSSALAERFRQERQILADLNHPNIARLLDGGTTPDGLPYLVMEFIAGQI